MYDPNQNYQQIPQQPTGQYNNQYQNNAYGQQPSGGYPQAYGQQPAGGYQQPYQQPSGGYQQPYQQPSQAPLETYVKPINQDVDDRVKFVRKVYSILACQLSLTAGFIFLVQTSDAAKDFATQNPGLAIGCAVGSIILMFAIVCCFGRVAPTNYILLLLFTLCETYMVGGLTAQYDPKTVMLAGLSTALCTIALTVYAWKTTVPIEIFAAMGWVVYLAMMPIAIIGFFMNLGSTLTIVYCCLGILLYSLYLIMDTMYICGGKSLSGNNIQCSMDDYIIGALMLYIDIIMLFIYILRILGNSKD